MHGIPKGNMAISRDAQATKSEESSEGGSSADGVVIKDIDSSSCGGDEGGSNNKDRDIGDYIIDNSSGVRGVNHHNWSIRQFFIYCSRYLS